MIKPMKEGRTPEYPEKTPGDELQKMPYAAIRRFKPLERLEPGQQHWWQARKADALTVTPRVALVRMVTSRVIADPVKGPAHAATFGYCNPQYRACNNRRPPCSKPAGLAGGLQGDRENIYPCKKVAVL